MHRQESLDIVDHGFPVYLYALRELDTSRPVTDRSASSKEIVGDQLAEGYTDPWLFHSVKCPDKGLTDETRSVEGSLRDTLLQPGLFRGERSMGWIDQVPWSQAYSIQVPVSIRVMFHDVIVAVSVNETGCRMYTEYLYGVKW